MVSGQWTKKGPAFLADMVGSAVSNANCSASSQRVFHNELRERERERARARRHSYMLLRYVLTERHYRYTIQFVYYVLCSIM